MEWSVKTGDHVNEMDKLCLVESDKASVEITSRYKGEITKLCFSQYDKVKIGSVLVEIEDGEGDIETQATPATQAKPSEPSKPSKPSKPLKPTVSHEPVAPREILATPQIRALAKSHTVDIREIKGTGSDGRITKEDILNFVSSNISTQTVVNSKDTTGKLGHSQVENLTGIRLAMAKGMTESASIPHLCLCEEVRVDRLLEFVAKLKEVSEVKFGLKNVTLTPFIIKAVSLALADFPELNSKCTQVADGQFEVETFSHHNVSVAIQSSKGLVVPNIKKVEELGVIEIQQKLFELIDRAQQGRLTVEDVRNGTVSISNIGVIGGVHAKPVLFDGQAMIGVVGKIQMLPRYDELMNIVPMQIIHFTWTADHRHVDGATIAKFSNCFKEFIENPEFMIAQ